MVAMRSSGDIVAFGMSSTVTAMDELVATDTVTLVTLWALLVYQISPSALSPSETAAALTHEFPAESMIAVTGSGEMRPRVCTAATRRSADPVAVPVAATSIVPLVLFAAPNDSATDAAEGPAGSARTTPRPRSEDPITPMVHMDR
jgi:hypothetical protein